MKISVLCENSVSDIGFLGEWGLSLFISVGGKNILFDTGYSDVFVHNAKEMKVNLEKTDFIVLSHYHNDHTRGLSFYKFAEKKDIIFHPDLIGKLPKKEARNIENNFNVIKSKEPLEFIENVFYLSEIPRKNNFEKGVYKTDPMKEDSAIAIKTKKGAVVISGCSHAGICNICEYAKKITGQSLYAVIGGFHLSENNDGLMQKTIAYFKQENPELLFPMHCVEFPALCAFYSAFNIQKLSAGDFIEM